MNSDYQMVDALLEIWTKLPMLAGAHWEKIEQTLFDLLQAFEQEQDAEERADIAIDIQDVIESVPQLAKEFQASIERVRAIRGASSEPRRDMSAEVRAKVRALLESRRNGEHQPPAKPAGGDTRVMNAWIHGLARDEPLPQDRVTILKFNVGPPHADARATGSAPFEPPFPADKEQLEVVIAIDTADFTVHGAAQQALIVPREGPSLGDVSFTIEPKRAGACTIKALCYIDSRIFQTMTIAVDVGTRGGSAAFNTASRGVTFESAVGRQSAASQVVNLVIVRRETGYQFLLHGGGVARAHLNLTELRIAEMVDKARRTFKEVVYTETAAGYVYQGEDTYIPKDVHATTLKTLARLGYWLYEQLFYSPECGADARQMGDLLRRLSQAQQLRISIVAERFVFPWALLYDCNELDLEQVIPEGFWGFKHIIEHLPEFYSPTLVSFIPQIIVSDRLNVGCIFNTKIDAQVGWPIIQSQRDFLGALEGVALSEHLIDTDLYRLLNDPDAPPQLLYFYCHAASYLPGEKDGVANSKLLLTDSEVTLADLGVAAPASGPLLKQAPLVFLNACQSARLNPYFYDGLVPYLITRGARGVLGTEVDTPALFAAEFAKALIGQFVAGEQPIGALLLRLRQTYLRERNNVLGLLYALYCNADVVVRRNKEND